MKSLPFSHIFGFLFLLLAVPQVQGQQNPTRLGGGYLQSGDSLFFHNQWIEGIRADEFEYLKYDFGRTATALYRKGILLKGISPSNLNLFDPNTFSNQEMVYAAAYQPENSPLRKIEGADPASFMRVEKSFFYKDLKAVYFGGEILRGANPEKIMLLNRYYTGDGKHFWFLAQALKGADPKTFETIGLYFARDRTQVFFQSQKITGALPESFEVLDLDFGKDARSVFYQTHTIDQARPQDFSPLHFGFAKDGQHVFFREQMIPMADAASFTLIGNDRDFSKDGKQVFWGIQILDKADPRTFEPLGAWYSKDDQHVYWKGTLIPQADPESFTSLDPYLPVRDISAEDEAYAKDKHSVFLNGKVLEGVKPSEFHRKE